MVSNDKYKYGVVLDAGSSGTRLYIYKWLKNDIARKGGHDLVKALPVLETHAKWTIKIHPGLSSFGDKPDRVGQDHLKGLLDHAIKYIPEKAVAETPIFLLATAGMRLLPDSQRNSVIESVCSYFTSETRFLISDCNTNVQVISGETEGLYGWIATNYLLGGFDKPADHNHGKGHHTYGFLDMGGASAQIAFAPNSTEAEKHANDLKLVRFRTIDGMAQEHRVFVTTWLGFGVNESRKRYLGLLLSKSDTGKVLDPCLPQGYTTMLDPGTLSPPMPLPERKIVGTGEFEQCMKKTYPLLQKELICLDEPCLINGQHVPAIDFDVNHFIGISEYWWTMHWALQPAGADEKVYDFKTYQTRLRKFCGTPWSTMQRDIDNHVYKKMDEQSAHELCFKASYLINMLYDGIGIPRVGLEEEPSKHNNSTKEIIEGSKKAGYLDPFQAVEKIKSTEVSWTMGKMALYASSGIPPASLNTSDSYPVGFGSNIPNTPIPSDFEYPGGRLQAVHSSSDSSQSLTDRLTVPFLTSDSLHRIPGLILFLLIISIALFYLCGRARRNRFTSRYLQLSPSNSSLGKKPQSVSRPSKVLAMVNRLLPFRHHRTSSDHERARALEEGSSTRLFDPSDFELGDFDSDTDSQLGMQMKSSGSGYASPTNHRSRTPRPKLPGGPGGGNGGLAKLMHLNSSLSDVDRTGLVVRTESRERLDLGLGSGLKSGLAGERRSRNSSVSPTRLKPL